MNQVTASSAVGVVITLDGACAQSIHVDHLLLMGKLLSTNRFTGMVEHPGLIFGLIVYCFAGCSMGFVHRARLQGPQLFVAARLPTYERNDLCP